MRTQRRKLEDGRAVRARLLRKQHPRWYCDKRKMLALPFIWMRFLPDAARARVPLAGALVLIVTEGFRGTVRRVPRGISYAQTVELFTRQGVLWWSYMPAMPVREYKKSGPLTCHDFFSLGRWRLGTQRRPSVQSR